MGILTPSSLSITSFTIEAYLQLLNFAYKRLLKKPYENEVTLIRQNPPLKCCQHLETCHTLKKGLDLSMLKILSL